MYKSVFRSDWIAVRTPPAESIRLSRYLGIAFLRNPPHPRCCFGPLRAAKRIFGGKAKPSQILQTLYLISGLPD
jgi:hypothetical protein